MVGYEDKKYLYVRLSNPLEFGVWFECDNKKPIGWIRAEDIINPKYPHNKLKVLTTEEIKEIKQRLKEVLL